MRLPTRVQSQGEQYEFTETLHRTATRNNHRRSNHLHVCLPGPGGRADSPFAANDSLQNNCAIQEDTDTVVHKSIAKAGLQAHAILEDCMDEILELEGWDRETLRMPEGLRRMRDELINKG